jgi:hypothetical protein
MPYPVEITGGQIFGEGQVDKRRKAVTKEKLTQITIVLDRSGSMAFVREAAISGFNEFVEVTCKFRTPVRSPTSTHK